MILGHFGLGELFWHVAIFFLAGVKTMTTVHTHVAEMHFPAIRTAVRAHSGNRWVGFLEGIDAQKLSWSTRCKTILNIKFAELSFII